MRPHRPSQRLPSRPPPITLEPLAATQATNATADSPAAPSASDSVDTPAAPSAPSTSAPSALFAAGESAADPTATAPADASLTPGWTQSGTCEWKIDAAGKLTIRPLGNGALGELGVSSGYFPWYDQRNSITSAVVEPGVSTSWCQDMFRECENMVTADLSGLNTQNVEGMSCMFFFCKALKSVNLSGVTTSNVKGMSLMFAGCSSLESLNLTGFDTSNVTYMNGMFDGTSSLTSLDLSSFDTSKVTLMTNMFCGCTKLASVNVTSFNTANVTKMLGMFEDCTSLEALDLSSFVISDSANIQFFFHKSAKLSRLTLSAGQDFTRANLREAEWADSAGNLYAQTYTMLCANRDRASGVETYVVPRQPTDGWTRVGTCEWMIDAAGKLTVRPLGNATWGSLGLPSGFSPWYDQRAAITSVAIEPGVNTSWCRDMFKDCQNMIAADISGLNTAKVEDMGSMFSGCKSLKTLDFSSFDSESVTNMSYMFSECESLESLDLSSFDTANVTNMLAMFSNCKSLKRLDLSSFDTSNATNMNNMFSDCDELEVLDLDSFDTSNVNTTSYLFARDAKLRTIYVSRTFATPASAMANDMFSYCTSLVGILGTTYDKAHTDAAYARIDGGLLAPGYLALKNGDVNCNGRLNVVDAQLAYDIALGKHTELPEYATMRSRADVAGAPDGGPDGNITANDAFAIQYAALHGWGV